MNFDPDIHQRHSIRLRGYDYSTAGFYFVTACVQNCECLLGEIVEGRVVLNDAGRMVENIWMELPQRFLNMISDIFVVMPNHFHGILILDDHPDGIINRRGESCDRPINHDEPGDHKDRPYGTLDGSVGRIVQAFKSLSTNAYIQGVNNDGWSPFPGKLWQRNYYERIIRDEEELLQVRKYIRDNPVKWVIDDENPANHQDNTL
ncbi:MAG: hypothetical protein KAH06_06035 [Desulfobacterales bacterium]|nr:hypothetical protein [Desulfobacterales bacterium]